MSADLGALYRYALELLYGPDSTPLPADSAGAATLAGAVLLDQPGQIAAARDGKPAK